MQTKPYGSWSSPISAPIISQSALRLGAVLVDGDDVYFTELRPHESGRTVVVKSDSDGRLSDVTPAPFNVRTLVHEYGGGAYVVAGGTVYFVNYSDQRIYKQAGSAKPEPLTAANKIRYADIIVDEKRNRLVCVMEDHAEENAEPLTTLGSVSLNDGSTEMLIAGNDFYSCPRLSTNGLYMCWVSWNHPYMPWDTSSLWAANVGSDGSLTNMRLIAGGKDESIFQPEWSSNGDLFYVSDRSGYWNLYRHTDYEGEQAVCPMEAEFGQPAWAFGQTTYGIKSDNSVVCAYSENGTWNLATVEAGAHKPRRFDLPYTDFNSVKVAPGKSYFIGASPTQAPSVVSLDLETNSSQIIRSSIDLKIDQGYLSTPETIEFPTEDGKRGYAFFYPPKNKDFTARQDERPPLIVKSHGGPTACASSALNLSIQFWTSRGFAVVDVNYGGSTGFGRAYRNRLQGSWGVVDVDDCVGAANFLVKTGRVDAKRLLISGGSAGGYTTLCALTFRQTFAGGASYYGISDLEALEVDTHKFESRYTHQLVGPYPASKELYKQRSPINSVERLSCPVIFLQGLEDRVVPPNQSELLVNALKKKRVPVSYVTFAGEQHGFRKAENIRRALESELYFYSRVLGFPLAEEVEPVEIDNLPAGATKR